MEPATNKMIKMKTRQSAILIDKVMSPKEGPLGLKEQLFRNQFKKTQLCRYHASGKCKSGRACTFAHGMSELNVAPDLAKTSMCSMWTAGKCDKSADECKFAHGSSDLRMTPLFQVSLPFAGNRMKGIAGLGTQDINFEDMNRDGPMRRITASTCVPSDGDPVDSPRLSDVDQVDDQYEAEMTPPQFFVVVSPAQHWLMQMNHFVASAPRLQRDMLAEVLETATPNRYKD